MVRFTKNQRGGQGQEAFSRVIHLYAKYIYDRIEQKAWVHLFMGISLSFSSYLPYDNVKRNGITHNHLPTFEKTQGIQMYVKLHHMVPPV